MESVGSMGLSPTVNDIDSVPVVARDATAGTTDQAAKRIRTDDDDTEPAHLLRCPWPLPVVTQPASCIWTGFETSLGCSADRA